MKLALAGDTMLGRGVAEVLAKSPTATLFADEVVAAFREADVAVVNLECCISTRGVPWPDPDKHLTDYVRRRGPFESHRPDLDEIAPTTMPVVADWLADRRQPWSSPAVCQRQKPSRMLHDHLPVSALEASSSWQRKTEAQPGPTC
jgi:hypothetical protein